MTKFYFLLKSSFSAPSPINSRRNIITIYVKGMVLKLFSLIDIFHILLFPCSPPTPRRGRQEMFSLVILLSFFPCSFLPFPMIAKLKIQNRRIRNLSSFNNNLMSYKLLPKITNHKRDTPNSAFPSSIVRTNLSRCLQLGGNLINHKSSITGFRDTILTTNIWKQNFRKYITWYLIYHINIFSTCCHIGKKINTSKCII